MTVEHDPKAVAATMMMVRGREAALKRCADYISGTIRSENTKEFWAEVRSEIEQVSA